MPASLVRIGFPSSVRGLLVSATIGFVLLLEPVVGLDSREAQLAAMEAILQEIDVHFGMAEFKYATFGQKVERLRQKYTGLIQNARTLEEASGLHPIEPRLLLPPEEFRQLMIGMIAELKDGHVNLGRLSHDAWGVGLNTAMIDGHLYVTGSNRDILVRNAGNQAPEVGDEILEINGVKVEDLARERLLYVQTATFESRWMDAMESTLLVSGRWQRPMVEGDDVLITLKRDNKLYKLHLNWINLNEYAKARSRYPTSFDQSRLKAQSEEIAMPFGFTGVVSSHFRQGVKATRSKAGEITDLGRLLNAEILDRKANVGQSNQSEKPELKPINRLQAYVVRHEGKNIGVLRVPSYTGQIADEIRWLAEVVKRFERLADVVILDVLSNSGGSVYYGTRLLSMLAGEESLNSIQANVRLNETLLYNWEPIDLERNFENGTTANFGEDRITVVKFEELKRKFQSGEKWSGMMPYFSNVTTSEGAGVIVPDPEARLTKPLLVLNDNRSASGGDFIPAVLQSARRALVMGETSQGLGGPVYRSIDSMPGSQMSFRCTMAYCERADGVPIENIGVVPDIHRMVTAQDLRGGFKDFAEDALAAAAALASGQSREQIQSLVNERLAKRNGNPALGEKINPIRELFAQFKASDLMMRANEDFKPEIVELAQAYKTLAKEASELGQGLTREEWRSLTLPVPASLVREDQVLSSLWKKAEFVERLKELERVPKWTDSPEWLIVTRAIADAAETIPGEVRMADPCHLLLRRP